MCNIRLSEDCTRKRNKIQMKQIKFNHNFLLAIKYGGKTQTRRLLKKHENTDAYPIVDDGHIKDYNFSNLWHDIKNYIEGHSKYQINDNVQITWNIDGALKKSLHLIKITNIRIEVIDDISDKDVLREGFRTKAEFLDTIHEIYGTTKGYCFVYEFELVKFKEQDNE